ncbi:MAG TPA: hypothetical protein VI854_03590 [Acidimicrobiia bacterium]|nr:hypothetical protein [Acidimicrobiia bacterium]
MNDHRLRPRLLAGLAAVLLAVLPAVPGGSSANAATAQNANGYWFVAADGGIFSYGDADFHGSTGDMALNKPIVGMAPTPTGRGYWFVAADGGIFSYGDAGFHGSTGALRLNMPIVGMAPTPTGNGYWFVASDGGIFAFGDARFFGSTGATRLNKPIVGMAATPTGNGYWFVASDGGIFAFGDAKYFGSIVTASLRSTMVGMAATPTGRGYWVVGSDGTVNSFGDASFHGSMGGKPLSLPVVGLTPTPTGSGYWLVASDGGIFSYGDAGFYGSTGDIALNKPIVGMAAAPRKSGASGPGPGGTSPSTTQPGSTPTTPTTTTTPTTPTTTPPGGVDWGASGTTTRVDRAGTGGGTAYRPWMSADGRYVAFDSDATKVIPGVTDPDKFRDVFLYDRVTKSYSRVTVGHDGSPATGPDSAGQPHGRPTLSGDARYVAFWTNATNLVPNDTNNHPDAFVRDMQTGTTTRISVGANGAQANDESARPVVSRDGRFVAFESDATNLVAGGLLGGGDTNNAEDVFVYEMASGQVARVSVSSSGGQGNGISGKPSISADGRFVAFSSEASNLVSGDTNGHADIFVHDRQAGETKRVSVAPDGAQATNASASPALSADGRFVSFDSRATNLGVNDNNAAVDVYVKDLQSGAVTRASVASNGSQGNNSSKDSSISGDGRFVAFWSDATDLVDGDTNAIKDVFVHDRQTGTTRRVSVSTAGVQGDNESFSPAMSVDGRFVAFDSKASNLDGGSTTGQDVFVHAL